MGWETDDPPNLPPGENNRKRGKIQDLGPHIPQAHSLVDSYLAKVAPVRPSSLGDHQTVAE